MGIPAISVKTKNYIVEYKLYSDIAKNYDKDEYEIAHICSSNYQEIIKIVYLKDCYKKSNQHCSLCEIADDYAEIYVSDFFINSHIKNSDFKVVTALFMHEMGHFVNKHYRNVVSEDDFHKYLKKRLEYIRQNNVLEEELEADRFAVNEVGKELLNNAIDNLIAVRRVRNDKGMAFAIKEFELRKSAISKM